MSAYLREHSITASPDNPFATMLTGALDKLFAEGGATCDSRALAAYLCAPTVDLTRRGLLKELVLDGPFYTLTFTRVDDERAIFEDGLRCDASARYRRTTIVTTDDAASRELYQRVASATDGIFPIDAIAELLESTSLIRLVAAALVRRVVVTTDVSVQSWSLISDDSEMAVAS